MRRLKNFKCNDCNWQSVLILTIEKKTACKYCGSDNISFKEA